MDEPDSNHSDVRGSVQAFYDLHPYPPPVKDLEGIDWRWQDEGRRRADSLLRWPRGRYDADLEVLVAGCGTSQAARHAARRPESHVVGIDVSAESVRHTEALKSQVPPDQSGGPPAAHRAGGRAGPQLRQDRVHGRAAPPARPGGGPARSARGPETRRRDGPDGLRRLRKSRRLPASGLLPPARHRPQPRRDPRPRRHADGSAAPPSAGTPAGASRRISRARTRSPTPCSTRRIAPTRCRSSSSSSRPAG